MTEPRADDSALLHVRRIRMVECPLPELPAERRRAMDRAWDEAVKTNPALFDGPMVVLSDLRLDEAATLTLKWSRATFRFHALGDVPGTPALCGLYASVAQPTTEGALLVGRMAPWTSAPARWQLPGGTVEPPAEGTPLDESALRAHAARELLEETGIEVPPDALTLVTVARGRNVGAIFKAPPLPAATIRATFSQATAAESAAGRPPELDAITFLPA
ncbi:NUDIX hydrolase, partial [Actinocorallia aurea]